jgi:AraC-like DNA-binding protein
VDPAEVFSEANVDLGLLDNPNNVISYATRSYLMERCVTRTGCRHFGLLVGQRGGLSSLGLVGYLVLHSPNVGSALRSLVHFFHLHGQGTAVALVGLGEKAFLSYSILHKRVGACDQIEDGAVAIAFNALRSLCGRHWQPAEIRFAHSEPEDTEPFRRYFRAPLRFEAEESGVLFPAEWLSQPVQGADPELHHRLREQVDALAVTLDEDFPGRVQRALGAALLTGHGGEEQIAALFTMNSRTLRRRLRACDTSFHEVANTARFEIARQMLESSELEVAQVASALGYADHSSFSRAFKRWSGVTPSKWRSERT